MVSSTDHDHWQVIHEITSPWMILKNKIRMYKIRRNHKNKIKFECLENLKPQSVATRSHNE